MSGSWLRDFRRLLPFLHMRNKKTGFRDGQDNLQKDKERRQSPAGSHWGRKGVGARGACQETHGGGGSWNWRAGCWDHSLAVMQSMLHTEVLD